MPNLGIVASSISGHLTPPSSFYNIATLNGTGASTITFSSIPSTYKSLQIRAIAKDNFANSNLFNIYVTFNSDTTANYASHRLKGNGTSATATGLASQNQIELADFASGNSATNIFGVSIWDIIDYSSTSKNKTLRAFGGTDQNGGTSSIELYSGLWTSTAAINRIDIVTAGTVWTSSTQFALYGVN